jgi:DUF1680 family protein
MMYIPISLCATFLLSASAAFARAEGENVCSVRLRGAEGARLDECIEKNVVKTDPLYLAECFTRRNETDEWQSEFWGKYMHSAAPYWLYTRNPVLKAKMDAGVEAVLSSQLPDGYIGNYLEKDRCRHDWDVWGMKYTMLGLIHYFDATGDRRALDAACRVCDYLRKFFPAKMPLRKSSEWNGLASCSVIEPVVWLYRRTGRKEYLDFAKYALSELEEPEDSCQILREAERGVHVADRGIWTTNCVYGVNIAIKAYESMSCWQGILDIYEETREKRLLDAAVKTAEDIVKTEINIAGGGASHERWYGGAARQTRPYAAMQETCVQTTWMRLCAKLLSITGESRWADEIEKTFLNAYLASLNRSNDTFSQYTPLAGWRAKGCEHCRMHTNCCNANGPRGFLAYMESFVRSVGGEMFLNFYTCARVSAKLPGGMAAFDVYGEYPRVGNAQNTYSGDDGVEFTLSLRRPSWRGKMSVEINGAKVDGTREGGYVKFRRRWTAGDAVSVTFDMPCVGHVRDGYVAFTRGPVVLARDMRFHDGDISEVVKGNAKDFSSPVPCDEIRPATLDMAMAFSLPLKMGPHTVRTIPGRPARVSFTDYASAGNTWMQDSSYRVWLPLELNPFE